MILLSSVWDGPNISSFFFSFQEKILGPSNPSPCIHTVLCAAISSGSTYQWSFWILAFACTVNLNCQNTSQNACYGCEKCWKLNSIQIFLWRTIYFLTCKYFWLCVQWPLVSIRGFFFLLSLPIPNFWTEVSITITNWSFAGNWGRNK